MAYFHSCNLRIVGALLRYLGNLFKREKWAGFPVQDQRYNSDVENCGSLDIVLHNFLQNVYNDEKIT